MPYGFGAAGTNNNIGLYHHFLFSKERLPTMVTNFCRLEFETFFSIVIDKLQQVKKRKLQSLELGLQDKKKI